MAVTSGDPLTKGAKPLPPKPRPPIPSAGPIDPLKELQALIASLSSGGGASNVDYRAEAAGIYAPQFSYLDQLAKDSEDRAAAAKKDVGGLYNALSSSILGQEKGIQGNYDRGIGTVGQAYNQAIGNVENQFDDTRNNSADVLKRLGIEQAGENVVGKSNQLEQLLTGIMGANSMSTQNAMRQGKEGAVTYNRQQGSAAKLAGAEAQTGLARQLADFMSQLGGKRADLNQQMNQSAFSMEQSAAENQQKSALQAAQDQYKMMIDERDFNYRMGKDKADYDLKAAAQVGGNAPRMDPLGSMQQLAQSLYGNSQSASNAIDAVSDALMQASSGGEEPTLGELLSVLQSRLQGANGKNIGDWPHLQRLAAMMLEN